MLPLKLRHILQSYFFLEKNSAKKCTLHRSNHKPKNKRPIFSVTLDLDLKTCHECRKKKIKVNDTGSIPKGSISPPNSSSIEETKNLADLLIRAIIHPEEKTNTKHTQNGMQRFKQNFLICPYI